MGVQRSMVMSFLRAGAAPMRSAAPRWRAAAVALLAAAALLAGCSHRSPKAVTASSLFQQAHRAMLIGDVEYAIRSYEALTSRFPFTPQARQARIDLIYCYY